MFNAIGKLFLVIETLANGLLNWAKIFERHSQHQLDNVDRQREQDLIE